MYVTNLYLQDFRQFTQATWEFTPEINVIVAPNGFGKTTIVEALSLLATGKSFRAGKTVEMVRFGQELARVYALTDDGVRLGMTLTGGIVNGRKTAPKHFLIDKTKKRAVDFVGNLLTATFRPEDLRLIEGSSERRRDYLDGPLTLTSQVYREALKKYQAALIRRNKTLRAIKEDGLSVDLLHIWDQQLLEYAPVLHSYRQEYIRFINEQVPPLRDYRVVWQPSLVDESRLREHLTAEIASGHSLIGPQRDQLIVEANLGGRAVDLAVYGSRGQQRLAVLWLKIAELVYLQQQTGRAPVLLLDDIFSELDHEAQTLVLEQARKQTTIITSIDKNVVKLVGKQVKVIEL